MKVRCEIQGARIFQAFLIALVLNGCGIGSYVVIPEPVQGYVDKKKIDLNVDLYLSDEFRNTKWEASVGFTSDIFFGDAFAYNSEEMARKLFSNVVVADKQVNSSKTIEAILIPKVRSINMPWVRGRWNDTVITAIFEWTLKDSNGNIVWIDTVKGEGHGKGGSRIKPTSVRVKALIHDLFRKSYQAISSSSEIREFVAVQ